MVIESYASLVYEQVSIAEAADSATRWCPVRSDIEQIQDASERAKMLIRHMLAFARRESAQAEDVDLGQVVIDASLLLGGLLGEQIPVTIRPARNAWPPPTSPSRLTSPNSAAWSTRSGPKDARTHPGDDITMSHTVLYIDDSDDNRVLVERILRRREDVRLRVARTGHDGIAAALGDPPNLILLDNRLGAAAARS